MLFSVTVLTMIHHYFHSIYHVESATAMKWKNTAKLWGIAIMIKELGLKPIYHIILLIISVSCILIFGIPSNINISSCKIWILDGYRTITWFIVKQIVGKSFQWCLIKNEYFFMQENIFEKGFLQNINYYVKLTMHSSGSRRCTKAFQSHYNNVIISVTVSQITRVSIVHWNVCSGTAQRKYQSSVSLAFVRGIHQWPMDSLYKGPAMWKMFPFDDIIITEFFTIKIFLFLLSIYFLW